MKFTVIVLFCIFQSIAGRVFNVSDMIMYPPQPSYGRIIGGSDAEDGAAPFQCSLQYNKRHFCGCALISAEWIVTASHCVEGENPKNVEVLVGTNDLKNGGTYYKVQKFIMHEEFNKPYFANDIAVVRVEGSIKLGDKVKAIEYSADEVPEGSVLQLTGWGQTETASTPQLLQIIKLNAVQTKKCREIHGKDVHDSHICTLTKSGEGACYGDSGGPLVFENKLVGVVNWGVPCALGYPDAYAKVSYLHDWIKSKAQD